MKPFWAVIFASALLPGCGGFGGGGAHSSLPSSGDAVPATSSGSDLLYATNLQKRNGHYAGFIEVFSFPQGEPYVAIRVHGFANGLCTDSSGNVWAIVGEKKDWHAYEFPHGGAKPISTIRIANPNYNAEGCAVDPASGDLAVLTGSYEGSGIHSYVYVWKGAKPGKPQAYPLNFTPTACAYDNGGNLFVDGYVGSTVFFELDKLSHGSNAVMNVAIDKALYGYPGGVQWDGTYLDAVSVSNGSRGTAIFRLQISGYNAHVADIVRPRKLYYASPLYLFGSTVVGTTGSNGQEVAVWNYPAGGKAIATLDQLQYGISGIAVSRAGSR